MSIYEIMKQEADMENVTLRQLEAFLAVSQELHFARAAQRLRVSAPWMSHTVRDLERALGVRSYPPPVVSSLACRVIWLRWYSREAGQRTRIPLITKPGWCWLGGHPPEPPRNSRSLANRTFQMPGPVPFVIGSPPCGSPR